MRASKGKVLLVATLDSKGDVAITKLHRQLKNTIIQVTHDQVEAMTMADRIVVLRDGYATDPR
jgi:multiple sugar transport system ATP-binding protein